MRINQYAKQKFKEQLLKALTEDIDNWSFDEPAQYNCVRYTSPTYHKTYFSVEAVFVSVHILGSDVLDYNILVIPFTTLSKAIKAMKKTTNIKHQDKASKKALSYLPPIKTKEDFKSIEIHNDSHI